MQGKGVLKFANGAIYEGSFFNNELHGWGAHIFPNGNIVEGNHENGLEKGIMTLTRADGTVKKY